ncbi:NF-E2 INDUCIBLE PROTEIN [Salix viminalis]|uniref:NF-E2 INDUCIBLE PROTEIN n=1 Tax=Salix viminalis TaxID=40686 RepID=A0A9Q0TN04_SALVM|nr:NF-E2 INDUCIBLE PROTEIN [Salix viminalis]
MASSSPSEEAQNQNQDQQQVAAVKEEEKECLHKTKMIQFLGRTTPIVLQNDNGPCPLLAICFREIREVRVQSNLIMENDRVSFRVVNDANWKFVHLINCLCNVLLLKNNLNLSPDCAEVSQEKLLSLVAERLIDSNSNNKDAGFVENQQQNIADAIDLLPQLATGIDVNLKFRRIDDFEFTRECAIFDLLDIPLYHGWIVDPQLLSSKIFAVYVEPMDNCYFALGSVLDQIYLDCDIANAIGSKSYNTLTGELVALETRNMEDESKNVTGEDFKNKTEEDFKNKTEEDFVDFVAATTATLGVPSPCLSKARSFDDSPCSVSDHQNVRKGDFEEAAALLRVFKFSEAELPSSASDSLASGVNGRVLLAGSDESTSMKGAVIVTSLDTSERPVGIDDNFNTLNNDDNNNLTSLETLALPREVTCSSLKTDLTNHFDQSTCAESGEHISCDDGIKNHSVDTCVEIQDTVSLSCAQSTVSSDGNPMDILPYSQKVENQCTSITEVHEPEDISSGRDRAELPGSASPVLESDSSSGRTQDIDAPATFTSSVGSEPIYEGEECILDTGTSNYEEREPMYEGEVVLAEQADRTVRSKDEITPQQGELIGNFLKNSASQLTFYGLFCLQDGLKERELCVFFRNNHFSTMFKYNGELYLLATDQGYINQPDLVWEKLNEVNGDTLFMTGNFKEFRVESHSNNPWDEHNAMTSTADYLASIDSAAQAGLDINSDLQLAIALQQQEFEQQPPQQPQQQQPQRHDMQQASSAGASRLITGPQVPSSNGKTTSSSSSKYDAKSKDKCNVM